MIFTREMTDSCRFRGIVRILCSRPSIRMRIIISFSDGSQWISEAFSMKARSMMELTSRIVGAATSPLSVMADASPDVTSSSPSPASARICAIACAAPSLPYSVLIAWSTALPAAIIGTMFFLLTIFACSIAMKFVGSAIARKSISFDTDTGTIRFSRASAFGIYCDISGLISVFVRSM